MEVKEISRDKVQADALDVAIQNVRATLAVSMGVGKTRVAIQHLMKLYDSFIRVLVVVPKWSVKDSWEDELQKMGKLRLVHHIEFCTYLSLNKKNPNDYDIVYLDECHSLLESHESFLSEFKGRILGLTGTPPRSGEKLKMVNKYCPVKYTFSVDDAADNDILNDYQIIVHELELSRVKNVKKSTRDGRTWYTSEKADYDYFTGALGDAQTPKQKQYLSIMRMKAMMDYPTKENYAKGIIKNIGSKCIVFANTQAQADRMCQHSYHSKNTASEDNLQLFSDGRIDKLSCVLQLSEGVTIPNLRQGIIMHAYGNERKSAQRIGRLLRLNPTETATCHILCYKNTQDVKWVNSALSSFDETKVKYYNPLNK
jgi:superfamily II DNA or RNA helicase|tara:strand:+ start:2623 stop:3729 length:1107 start_codon:yes stop_codon:yes gene_type:complete